MYVHGNEERLMQAAREDKIEAASILKRSKKEKVRRLGGESCTWPVFGAD